MAYLHASQLSTNGLLWSGMSSTGGEHSAALSASNALCCSAPHCHGRGVLGQLRERQRDVAVVLHEAAVEVGQPEERAHVGDARAAAATAAPR